MRDYLAGDVTVGVSSPDLAGDVVWHLRPLLGTSCGFLHLLLARRVILSNVRKKLQI